MYSNYQTLDEGEVQKRRFNVLCCYYSYCCLQKRFAFKKHVLLYILGGREGLNFEVKQVLRAAVTYFVHKKRSYIFLRLEDIFCFTMGSGVSFADPECQWEEFAEIYDEHPEKWEVRTLTMYTLLYHFKFHIQEKNLNKFLYFDFMYSAFYNYVEIVTKRNWKH